MPSPHQHRPRLTAGQFAASLKTLSQKDDITQPIQAALANGPLSLAELGQKTGQGLPLVASAVRSQPKLFVERGGLVYAVAKGQ